MLFAALYPVAINKKVINTENCTSTKFHCLLNCTIFTDQEDVLNLIDVKYFEIGINL